MIRRTWPADGITGKEAIQYLRRTSSPDSPRPSRAGEPEELAFWSPPPKGIAQRYAPATVLEAHAIIHHLDGGARLLFFMLPLSDQGGLSSHPKREGLPDHRRICWLRAFPTRVHRRAPKNKGDSLYTKIMSKPGHHAAAIYDRLRVAIVPARPRTYSPSCSTLARCFVQNYVIPGREREHHLSLQELTANGTLTLPPCSRDAGRDGHDLTTGDKPVRAQSNRTIHLGGFESNRSAFRGRSWISRPPPTAH